MAVAKLLLPLLALVVLASTGTNALLDNTIHVQNDDPNTTLYVKCEYAWSLGIRERLFVWDCTGDSAGVVALKYSEHSTSDSVEGRPNEGLSVIVSPCPDFSEFNLTLKVANTVYLGPTEEPFFILEGARNETYFRIQNPRQTLRQNETAYFSLPGGTGTDVSVRRAEDSGEPGARFSGIKIGSTEWWMNITGGIPECSRV